LLAPQAQAQLTLHKVSATITLNESSLNFSDTLLLPQFQTLVPRYANAQLYGVDITEITNASIFGTVTNSSSATQSFAFESGALTSTTLPSGGTLSSSALMVKNLTLGSGAAYTFNANIRGLGDTGLVTSNPGAFQGTGTVAAPITGLGFTGFTNANGLGTSGTGGSGTITVKEQFWFYAPFTPVPELGTSISLGLMGLVGGALGLRARRRAR
jgi:hypothetical protein